MNKYKLYVSQGDILLSYATPFGNATRTIAITSKTEKFFDVMWRLLVRHHIHEDVEVIGQEICSLKDFINTFKDAKQEEIEELSKSFVGCILNFSSRKDYLTIAGFAKSLLKTSRHMFPLPQSRRPK